MKYTQVAETPENKRLKGNSDANSKAKYQAEFQKQKGTKISISDDAAGEQLKQVQAFQSHSQYQKEFKESIVGSKTSVAHDMDSMRLKQVQEQSSRAAYQKEFKEQIKGSATATTDDIKGAYLKDLQSMNKYQEEYKKNIIGTKTSVADDLMGSHLKDAQTKISSIGYKQKTVSGSSRPTSMISESGSIVIEDDHIVVKGSSENDSGMRILEVLGTDTLKGLLNQNKRIDKSKVGISR